MVRFNWNTIINRAGQDSFVRFATGNMLAHDFRNSSMEARKLISHFGNAGEVRRRALTVARRRNLV